jgi:hypothetical protein
MPSRVLCPSLSVPMVGRPSSERTGSVQPRAVRPPIPLPFPPLTGQDGQDGHKEEGEGESISRGITEPGEGEGKWACPSVPSDPRPGHTTTPRRPNGRLSLVTEEPQEPRGRPKPANAQPPGDRPAAEPTGGG